MQKKYNLDLPISSNNTSILKLSTDLNNVKITDANLILKKTSGTGTISVSYYLNETTNWTNVDKLEISDNFQTYKINVTDELQEIINNNLTEAQIKLVLNNGDSCAFETNVELEVEYCDIEEFKSNGGNHSLDMKGAGIVDISLNTRDFSLSRKIASIQNGALNFDLIQNYNSNRHPIKNRLDLKNGVGWNLSCQQYLIEEKAENDDTIKGLRFKFIDSNGKTHTLEEKYYYTDDENKKHYVCREDISVDLNGNLRYTTDSGENINIKTELITNSGFKMVSSIADIRGSNYIDYEPQELSQLKEQLKQYTSALEDIHSNIEINNQQICIYALTKEMLNKQIDTSSRSASISVENAQIQEAIEKIFAKSAKINREDKSKPLNDFTIDALEYISECYYYDDDLDPNYTVDGHSKNTSLQLIVDEKDVIYSLGANERGNTNGSYILNKLNADLQNDLYNVTLDSNDLRSYVNSILGVNKSKIDYTALHNAFVKLMDPNNSYENNEVPSEIEFKLSNKDLYSLQLQANVLVSNNLKFEKQLQEYNELITKCQNEIHKFELQTPVHYLYNDNGIVLGFGKTDLTINDVDNQVLNNDEVQVFTQEVTENTTTITGSIINNDTFESVYRLVYITDFYDNQLYISYDSLDNNKLNAIQLSNEKVIQFNYNDNNLIEEIIDDKENRTKFFYNDSMQLVKVISNNDVVHYYYDSSDKLVDLVASSGTGCHISYLGNLVENVSEINIVKNVVDGQIIYEEVDFDNFSSENYILSDKTINFVNDDFKSTTIIDSKGNKITYNFDKFGNVITVYKNALDLDSDTKCVEVMQYNYKNDKVSEIINNLPYSKNYLASKCFQAQDTSAIFMSDTTFPNISLVPYDYTKCGVFHSINETSQEHFASMLLSDLSQDAINDEQMLILSGWAKADSAFILNNDDESDYPDYIKNRKFEIRAVVTYVDGSIQTFKKQFDWMNLNWQYCALPIYIGNRTIESINCIFDYSNNTNNVDFTDFVLTAGNYEIVNYNEDKSILSKENSNSKWVSYYYYNKNNQIEKEVVVDKNNENLISDYTNAKNNQTSDYSVWKFIKDKIYNDNLTHANYLYVTTYEYNKNGKLLKVINYDGIVQENVYNDYGIAIKTITYHKDEPTSKLYNENKLDETGKPTSELNELGQEVVSYEYGDKGEVINTIDKNNNKISYAYDNAGRVLEISSNIDGETNANTQIINNSIITGIRHNGFEITFNFDKQNKQSDILIAGKHYLSKQYNDNEETVYLEDNQHTLKTTYDNNGNPLDTYYDGHLDSRNFYDTFGNLAQRTENPNDSELINHVYTYDKDGNVIGLTSTKITTNEDGTTENQLFSVVNNYLNNHISTSQITFEGGNQNYTYEYDENHPDFKLKSIQLPSEKVQSIKYDKLNRISELSFGNVTKLFNYLKNGDHASNLVSSIWYGDETSIKENIKYTYDEKGNITEIRENGDFVVRYSYDGLSRLIREDNKALKFTSTFEYDAGGNILRKKVFDFTLNSIDEFKEKDNISYEYSSNGWRDQLLSYHGKKIEEYDNLGNPHKYQDKSLDWSHGRRLIKFGDVSFSYDSNGIRTAKTVGSETTSFVINGNKIIASHKNNDILSFGYGVDGLIEFIHNNKHYTYKKNVQGDIIGIYEKVTKEDKEENKLIVKYAYDAWGKHSIFILKSNDEYLDLNNQEEYNMLSGDEKTLVDSRINISTLNPFRYRGYYYDIETGLYYLNSRYYDPETGRFINADDISYLDKNNLNGFNLYAYCGNNPIMNIDSMGNAWWNPFSWSRETWMKIGSVALIIVGAVAVVATAGVAGAVATVIGIVGSTVLGAGIGSLVGGYANQQSGGSFSAGWTGGLVSGSIIGLSGGIGGAMLGSSFTTGISVLKSFGYIAGGLSTSFLGGFGGNYLGGYTTAKMDGVQIDAYTLYEDSLFAGFLNMISASFSYLNGSATSKIKLEVLFTKTLPFLNQFFSDIVSYTYSKFRNKIW